MPPIPTEALLDVNVVIASVFADHTMHGAARRFVEIVARFHTTPTTQGGFLRFATRPWKNARKEEQPPRLAMMEAQAKLTEFTNADGHVFLPDDEPFTELGLRSMQGHRQWTDAYLLHLARKHGLALASLESRMANLDDAANPALFVIGRVGVVSSQPEPLAELGLGSGMDGRRKKRPPPPQPFKAGGKPI